MSSKATPPYDDEAQKQKLIALAYRQAEQELTKGKASSQMVTHFLKLGAAREEIELRKLELENQLLAAKIQSLNDSTLTREMFEEALAALKRYTVAGDEEL